MRKKSENNLFVGLDIGTTKVVALVGAVGLGGHIDIIGIGSHPSRGLKRGIVINIDATVQSIKRAIEEAELMAGCEIHSVYTGIAGSHIRSLNSHGIVAIRDREITQVDIDRVIDAAKAVAIPADQKILHILPQEFIIDNQEGVREPIGMSGVRLEAKVHIVTGSVSAVQNIVKCIERCGLHVSDIVLQQLASSTAVLTDDEKELGVCLVDIGGGTTDIAVFTDGAIRHSAVIPIAGDQVTNDIAVALRTSTKNAEELKIKYACALERQIDSDSNTFMGKLLETEVKIQRDDDRRLVGIFENKQGEPANYGQKLDEYIAVPSSSNQRPAREIPRKFLIDVVGARYEELFALVYAELKRSRFVDTIGAGIVLTGGASKIDGIIELAEQVFKLPVRVGVPQHIGGMVEVINNPIYATGAGLLLTGHQYYQQGRAEASVFGEHQGLWSKMRNWFQANF